METTLDGIRDVKVYQHKNGYRFSVDALLLYAFVNVKHAKHIADLGAGSGIIGLLLARRYAVAKVLLVELQEKLAMLAKKNAAMNGLEDRVSVLHADIGLVKSRVAPGLYDVAVSNPPFRKAVSGRISEGEEKALARHEIRLSLQDLAQSASHLLRSKGRFFMIFHPERILEVMDVFRGSRLEPKRLRFVHNDVSAVSKIVLIEAVKEGRAGLKIEKPLFLYDEEGNHTEELKGMYSPD